MASLSLPGEAMNEAEARIDELHDVDQGLA